LKEVLSPVQEWEWQVQWSPMKVAEDQAIAEAIITEATTMDVPVPGVDGTRVVTTGETLQAIEMDGEAGIVDVVND